MQMYRTASKDLSIRNEPPRNYQTDFKQEKNFFLLLSKGSIHIDSFFSTASLTQSDKIQSR